MSNKTPYKIIKERRTAQITGPTNPKFGDKVKFEVTSTTNESGISETIDTLLGYGYTCQNLLNLGFDKKDIAMNKAERIQRIAEQALQNDGDCTVEIFDSRVFIVNLDSIVKDKHNYLKSFTGNEITEKDIDWQKKEFLGCGGDVSVTLADNHDSIELIKKLNKEESRGFSMEM